MEYNDTINVRIGNDIRLYWTIYKDGVEEDFSQAVDMSVKLFCARGNEEFDASYTVDGGVVAIDFTAAQQSTIGIWDALLSYKLPNAEIEGGYSTITLNTCSAIRLVDCSSETDENSSVQEDSEGNPVSVVSIKVETSLLRYYNPTIGSLDNVSASADGTAVEDMILVKDAGSQLWYPVPKPSIEGEVYWNDVKEKPAWIGSSKPSYVWDEIGEKPDFGAYLQAKGAYSNPTYWGGIGVTYWENTAGFSSTSGVSLSLSPANKTFYTRLDFGTDGRLSVWQGTNSPNMQNKGMIAYLSDISWANVVGKPDWVGKISYDAANNALRIDCNLIVNGNVVSITG